MNAHTAAIHNPAIDNPTTDNPAVVNPAGRIPATDNPAGGNPAGAGNLSGGRTLDSSRDPVILQAALELVAEIGYERVTMDAIAARARSSKATIYRRWSSKAELVVEAMKCRHCVELVLPETGNVRNDLLGALRTLVSSLDDLALLVGLLNAMRKDRELARLLRSQMIEVKQNAVQDWLQRAVDHGTLPADANIQLFNEVAPAMMFVRLLLTGQAVDDEYLERIVDDVLLPLLLCDHSSLPLRCMSPNTKELR